MPHRDLSANDALETRLDGLKRQLEKQQVLIEEQQGLIHALREEVDKPVRGISGPAARLCALAQVEPGGHGWLVITQVGQSATLLSPLLRGDTHTHAHAQMLKEMLKEMFNKC